MKKAYRVDLTKSFDENATRSALFPFASIAHVVQAASHDRQQKELKFGDEFCPKQFRRDYRGALGEAASVEGLKLMGYAGLSAVVYSAINYLS